MNTIQVSTQQLKSKASELKSMNSKLNGYINTLISTENSLNAMWDGEANDTFHKAFASDVKQMQNFYSLIEKYAQALDTIAANYEKAENTNTSTASARTYH